MDIQVNVPEADQDKRGSDDTVDGINFGEYRPPGSSYSDMWR